jgi:hypothetical protein
MAGIEFKRHPINIPRGKGRRDIPVTVPMGAAVKPGKAEVAIKGFRLQFDGPGGTGPVDKISESCT